MEKQRISNYEQTRNQMEKEFLHYDQEKMIARYALKSDPSYIYINFVGKEYRVDRNTGRVEWSEDSFQTGVHADFNESMTIFDVLCYAKDTCCLSGKFAPVNDLKGVAKTVYLGSNLYTDTAKFFEHKVEQLKTACSCLGGIPGKVGDVSYQIPLFDFMPVILQFWDGDDEFAPVLKLMWDENALDYMHYETTYYAVSHLLQRIKELILDMQ